jgi:hypothetical protein
VYTTIESIVTRPHIQHRRRNSTVGDAVAGAEVTVDGRRGKTDKGERITFRFATGAQSGSFKVVASTANYLKASTFLRIT